MPGEVPGWIEDFARHVSQRLTPRGRVLVAFTHRTATSPPLPGQPEQSSLLGHSASGYPLWMGRRSAVLGFRRRCDDTILILSNHSSAHHMGVFAAFASRVRRERLVVVEVDALDQTSVLRRLARMLIRGLAVRTIPPPSLDAGHDKVALALCGDDIAFADLVARSAQAMPEAAATGWRFVLQVEPGSSGWFEGSDILLCGVTVCSGQASRRSLWGADITISPHASSAREVVAESVLFGGAGIVVGGPVAGRVLRQPDGVWLARHECAALLVALEMAGASARQRAVAVDAMRGLAEEVVGHVTGDVRRLPN